jgi:hypothetical protein
VRYDIFHFAAENKTVHPHNAHLFPPMANFFEKIARSADDKSISLRLIMALLGRRNAGLTPFCPASLKSVPLSSARRRKGLFAHQNKHRRSGFRMKEKKQQPPLHTGKRV